MSEDGVKRASSDVREFRSRWLGKIESSGALHDVLVEVAAEVERATKKHGGEAMVMPHHGVGKRLGILGEEFGEVCRATTYDNGSAVNLREELIQTAAMAVAWVVSMGIAEL